MSLGTWGHVLPAHMREGLIHYYQRGFGVDRVFLFGVSVGSFGVGAALCSGAHFFRARVAGACLAFWRWHCSRRPSRATGRKLSGQGKLRIWNVAGGNMRGTLALVGLPSRQSNDTYPVLKPHRVPQGNNGRFGERCCGISGVAGQGILGQARTILMLKYSTLMLDIEVFNIGGILTHGDHAWETDADLLAVVEHSFIPAGARSEGPRLAVLKMPGCTSYSSFATASFSSFFFCSGLGC